MCGEEGSEGTSGSGLVEHYLENDQADDTCPKDQPLSVQGRLREHSSFWEQNLARGLTNCTGHNHQWLQTTFLCKESLLSS